MTVLVLSHAGDDHATAVLGELARAGHPAVLVDTAEYPTTMGIVQHFGAGPTRLALSTAAGRVDLTECHAAWWRRPQPYVLHPGLDPAVLTFTYSECSEAIAGMWAALDATWVNPPTLDEQAHHKPYQLALAGEVGLTIPRTLITNDPDEARAFVSEVGLDRTVYKTFLATDEHWRETRVLKAEELELLDGLHLAPVIFQEYVRGAADLRVTVMGDDVFVAEVKRQPGAYEVDYRMDIDGATFVPTTIPDNVGKRVHRLLERLGLVYGAVDLLRTPEGEHVFLEVNPAGEWLFVEERTGQPMSAAMASLLARLDTR